MKQEYQPLHHNMLQDVERCMQLALPEAEKAERCFWIARNYWEKLKEFINVKVFKDDNDEIDFFRNVKPQFTCYIEYFVLLSEALLFEPAERDDAVSFWEAEMEKFNRYCQKHKDFVQYYESGLRHSDSNYFLRRNKDLYFVPLTPMYDVNTDYCTTHDQYVRSYLAHKKYYEYVKKKFEIIRQAQSDQ